jgi:predicted phage tail protein
VILTAAQARVLNPGPPTGLTATAGNGQVSLSWSAPASDGGAAISGYDLYLGTSSHGESASPVNGSLITVTSYTVTGLANGTTYYFTAVAVNGAGLRSVASAEASATPAAPVTAPGAPAALTATAGNAQVSLSWRAPGSDGGAQITSYNIYEGTSQTITGQPVASVKGTSVTVQQLANGTTYYFKVTAVNQAGEGPASGVASATPAAAITEPGPPAGLAATPGDRRVTLSWTAPSSDGGAKISGYLIYQGTSPGGESGVPVNGAPAAGTRYTLTGLRNGTRYYFTVAAVNGAKLQGNHSGEASATPVSATASASASASASGSASASPSAGAGTGTGAGTNSAGGAAGPASAGPAGKAVLTSKRIPKPVIVSLAAVAFGATAGAMALTARRLRLRRRPPLPPPQDVRAVPDQGRPGPVCIREIGADETYTVRLEPLPAAIITTIEELRS